MAREHVEIDPVLHALGAFGPFSCVQLFLYFWGYISDAHQMFAYVFIGQPNGHRCAAPTNSSNTSLTPMLDPDWLNYTEVTYGECFIYAQRNHSGEVITDQYPCVYGMEYDMPKYSSIISEFDLVCDRGGLAELTQTLMACGTGLGAIVCPWLSDLYGRKRMLIISEILTVGTSFIASYSPHYIVFAICKFFLGFLTSGVGLSSVTAVVELFPTSYRAYTSGLISIFWWVTCIASLSPVAYGMRDRSWRELHMAITGFSFPVIFMIFFLHEPVRWLIAKGKHAEAEKVIKKAAKMNRKNYKAIIKLFHGLKSSDSKSSMTPEDSQNYPNHIVDDHVEDCVDSHFDLLPDVHADGKKELIPPVKSADYSAPAKEVKTWNSSITDIGAKASDCEGESKTISIPKMFRESDESFFSNSNGINASDFAEVENQHRKTPSKGNDKTTEENQNGGIRVSFNLTETVSNDREMELQAVLSDGKDEASVVESSLSAVPQTEEGVKQQTEENESLGFIGLARHPLLRRNTILVLYIMFVDALTYWALYLTTHSLAVGIYVGLFLNATVEGSSGIVMMCMLNRLGRKKTVAIFQAVAAIGMIASGVCFWYADNPIFSSAGTVASLVGIFGIGGAFNIMFLYAPEIFPTSVRNRALGLSVTASTVGGMVAPFSQILAKNALWGPGAVFGILNVLAVLCLLVLPESRGKELPQTTRDLEAWYEAKSDRKRKKTKN